MCEVCTHVEVVKFRLKGAREWAVSTRSRSCEFTKCGSECGPESYGHARPSVPRTPYNAVVDVHMASRPPLNMTHLPHPRPSSLTRTYLVRSGRPGQTRIYTVKRERERERETGRGVLRTPIGHLKAIHG